MKKVIASVLSLILAFSASALVPSGNINAAYNDNENTYEDESRKVQVGKSGYSDVYDESHKSYVSWYTLYDFSSQKPEAYIPEEVNAKKIFSLYTRSCDCSNIECLVLPKTIKFISGEALYNCDSLRYLTIPDNVADIGDIYSCHNAIIRGYDGSFAQKYAKKHCFDFVSIGDCDENGTICVSDLRMIMQFLLNKSPSNIDYDEVMFDCNLDEKVNAADLIFIIDKLMSNDIPTTADPNKSAVAVPDMKKVNKVRDYKNESYNSFTAKTINALYKDNETENEVCSPLSLYMGLSQAAECSDGGTLDEFLNVLGASSLEELRTYNSSLVGSLYFDQLSRYMNISNSVWLNKAFAPEQDPIDMLADKYYASVFSENFSNPASVSAKMNEWISNATNNLNPDITVKPNDDIIKIINTVNFKDSWEEPFEPATEGEFTKKDGTKETCQYLKNMYIQDTVGLGEHYMKFSVDMLDHYKMSFVLPDEDSSVNDIVSDSDTLIEIIDDTMTKHNATIHFSVPKFDVDSKFNFNETGKKLGLTSAFLNGDFSRIYDENSAAIDLEHEARVAIDEQGCTASSYSVATVYPTCPPPKDEMDFDLNRPFIYYVSDENGTPVFMGIINDPLQD